MMMMMIMMMVVVVVVVVVIVVVTLMDSTHIHHFAFLCYALDRIFIYLLEKF